MSAGDAGFDKLYAGKIVSDSVASLGGQGSLSYTVGTGGHFSTISDCLNNLPTLQRGSVKISLVSNLTEIVRIENRTFNKLDIDLGGYTPVSYTHLDVYKRQQKNPTGFYTGGIDTA